MTLTHSDQYFCPHEIVIATNQSIIIKCQFSFTNGNREKVGGEERERKSQREREREGEKGEVKSASLS